MRKMYVLYGKIFSDDKAGYIESDGYGRWYTVPHLFDAMYCYDVDSAKKFIDMIQPYKVTICKVEVTPIEEDE